MARIATMARIAVTCERVDFDDEMNPHLLRTTPAPRSVRENG
jgi:hypothetical protein